VNDEKNAESVPAIGANPVPDFLSGDQLSGFLDSLWDGVYLVDRERTILHWNKGAERISGFTAREIVGRHCFENLLKHIDHAGCNLCTGACPLSRCMAEGAGAAEEVYLHHKLGHRVPVAVRTLPRRDARGEITGAIEIFTDRSSLSSAQERINQLETLAYLDPLTGLANRRYTEIFLRAHLSEMKRYRWPLGVVFMDVDDFKSVNDRHGHDRGDRLLRALGLTLSSNARHYDLVGRWGGEEFLAVLVNVDQNELASIAEKFRFLVEQSALREEGNLLAATLSCGAIMAHSDDTMDSLVKRADGLMYRAKRAGGNRVVL